VGGGGGGGEFGRAEGRRTEGSRYAYGLYQCGLYTPLRGPRQHRSPCNRENRGFRFRIREFGQRRSSSTRTLSREQQRHGDTRILEHRDNPKLRHHICMHLQTSCTPERRGRSLPSYVARHAARAFGPPSRCEKTGACTARPPPPTLQTHCMRGSRLFLAALAIRAAGLLSRLVAASSTHIRWLAYRLANLELAGSTSSHMTSPASSPG